jgi:hypothetical protein
MDTRTNRLTGKTGAHSILTILVLLGLVAAHSPGNVAAGEPDGSSAVPVVARLIVRAWDGDTGRVLGGAEVAVFNESGTLVDKGTTSSAGTYITYLAEGFHKASISSREYADRTYVVEMTLGTDTELGVKLYKMTVPPGSHQAEAIEEGQLRVYTRSATDGAVILNATVLVLDESGTVMAKGLTRGKEGEFMTGLPAGAYKVWVYADGYREVGQVVHVEAMNATNLKVALPSNNPSVSKPPIH